MVQIEYMIQRVWSFSVRARVDIEQTVAVFCPPPPLATAAANSSLDLQDSNAEAPVTVLIGQSTSQNLGLLYLP